MTIINSKRGGGMDARTMAIVALRFVLVAVIAWMLIPSATATASKGELESWELNTLDARQAYSNIKLYWPNHTSRRQLSEALGIETALIHLEKDSSIRILYDGRPGGPSKGPDIIALNTRTDRLIIVEAKGRLSLGSALSGSRLLSGQGQLVESSRAWLVNDPERYMGVLREKHSEAARAMDDVLYEGRRYDVLVLGTRASDGRVTGERANPGRNLLDRLEVIGEHLQNARVTAVVATHPLTNAEFAGGPPAWLRALDRQRDWDTAAIYQDFITGAARDTVGRAVRAGAAPSPSVMAAPDMTTTAPGIDGKVGGVDLSSLELRYVSDVSSDKTRAASFAFKAPPKNGGGRGDGRNAAKQASEAFFVFLALDPRTFTVNLQPDQPDRIVDEKLGRTNAGRVLLEADLRMKKKTASLIHPKSRLGRRYWSQVYRILGWKKACVTVRQWIVPTQATVHENDGELYILKAPLSVKLRSQQFKTAPAGINASCGKYDPALQARIEAVYRRLVLPRIQRAVRTAREFAALRRVYFSRIAAEWYRERVAARNGRAFAAIVDSGDISPWAPTRAWTPRDVFDRYVTSYTEGEFNVKHRVRVGNLVGIRTYVWGGVDFSGVPRRNVSPRELATLQPGLARRISAAFSQPAVDRQSGEVWLAGTSFDPAAAAEDPAFGGGGFQVSTLILGLLAVLLIPLLAYLSRIATASAVRPQQVMRPAVDQTVVVDQTAMKGSGWGAKLNSYRKFFVSAFVIALTLCITLFLVSQIRDSQRRAAKEAQIRSEQRDREIQRSLDKARRQMELQRQQMERQTQQTLQALEETWKSTCRAVPDLSSCKTRPPR